MSGPILHKIMHHPMAGKVMSGALGSNWGDGSSLPAENGVMFLPDFTGYTTAGFTVTDSGAISGGEGFEALNLAHSTFDVFYGSLNVFPWFIAVECDQQYPVYEYSIRGISASSVLSRNPKNWELQGSNDGTNWDTLHSVTNAPAWAVDELRVYTPPTIGMYLHYRFYCTETIAGTSGYSALGTLKLFS
jgi:hypothetical protein